MTIKDNLLQDANFRNNLEISFQLIEQNIEKGTLWNCGVTSRGIVIVKNDDSIIDKIIFVVKRLFWCIDTSYSSMQELKQRVKCAELNQLTTKTAKVRQKLENIKQKHTDADGVLYQKEREVGDVTNDLNFLKTAFQTEKEKYSKLDEAMAAKQKEFELLEQKLKAIAKEEELEAKLQAQRIASLTLAKEIENITEDLSAKHAALISSIDKTELGLMGWLTNASQMITEKRQALKGYLANDAYVKPYDCFDVVLNNFRKKLHDLKKQIPLIKDSKEYADFLTQLGIIETSGWSDTYSGTTYTVGPKSQSILQKTILREIKELTELTFIRNQIMALTA